jgi:hypothetical protein
MCYKDFSLIVLLVAEIRGLERGCWTVLTTKSHLKVSRAWKDNGLTFTLCV